MSVFRRRRRRDEEPADEDFAAADEYDEDVDEDSAEPAAPPRTQGPWDAADVPDDGVERFDLGGLRVAVPEGGQLQLEMAPDGTALPTVLIGEAGVQLSAFAAPRTSAEWAEIRGEIAAALRADGGAAEEADGPFGPELHAQVPVSDDKGQVVLQPARFVGVDGPRWFLRGVFTGPAATPASPLAAALEEVFRQTVVVRGKDAMAPRDAIPLRVPRDVLEAAGVESPEGFAGPGPPSPFARGPEITEVR